MKTHSTKLNDVKKHWYIADASEKILGRFATGIARILRGKHKIEYSPHMDIGDYLIVINASKILVTGKKYNNKFYYRHTGYVGGIKRVNFKEMILKFPEQIIKIAVKGMLPKGALGSMMLSKLKVYSNSNHKHVAQNPICLNF